MPQTAMIRAYDFSDADLKQKADALMVIIKRDRSKFATRNIRKEDLAKFQQTMDAFAHASIDAELLDLCKKNTAEKDKAAATLRRLLYSIRNMAELAFEGNESFLAFGFEGMSEMNDNELCVLAKRVYRLSHQQLAYLKPQGLVESHLEALSSLEATLDVKLDACKKVIEKIDIETKEQIAKGNAVYAAMMHLASVGKSLFEDEDEGRYNDYVMIAGSDAKLEAPVDGKAVVAIATD